MFTIIVPGAGAVWAPWAILNRYGGQADWSAWYGVILIVAGAALYLWCLSLFAIVGTGTPGLWDPPRQVVAAGPYRWVRNPIYIGALLVVMGEAWLFLSLPLLIYAGVMAACFHLFVIGYEEPRLGKNFGLTYEKYLRVVPRWIPRRPH